MNLAHFRTNVLFLLLSAVAACGSLTEQGENGEATIFWRNGETVLLANVGEVTCVDGVPRFSLTGRLSTTGEASTIDLFLDVDGLSSEATTLLVPQDFQEDGGANLATFKTEFDLPEGTHTVTPCLVQRSGESEDVVSNLDGVGPEDLNFEEACLPLFEYEQVCERREAREPPLDKTHPEIVATRRQSENDSGWYNEALTVSFACFDEESGIASCSEAITLTEEGVALTVKGVAEDKAGNISTATAGIVRIDMTPPAIEFSGNRSYLVDERVEAGCLITDALSGVKMSTCTGNSGDAYMFDLGTYSIEGTASDLAGNNARAASEFSIGATAESVCNVLKRFVTARDVAGSLCLILSNAELAFDGGDNISGAVQLEAFHEEVDEQTDIGVPAEHAGTLLRLSIGLRPER